LGKNLESNPLEDQEYAEYWDIAAQYWEDITTVNPYWGWKSFYSHHIPKERINILVLGVTHGAFLKLLTSRRPQAWVCGIDISVKMLTHARKVEKKGVCCQGDELPFKDKSFDMVLSDYFLSVLQQDALEKTVDEVERVLRPNGVFIAKELRHRGHWVLWAAASFVVSVLCVIAAVFLPVLSVLLGALLVLTLLTYNPVTHRIGCSAFLFKWVLHVFRFAMRRRKIPTLKEMKDLCFLSRKYLHIFTDEELDHTFQDTVLDISVKTTWRSWNFSIVGEKS
jgi:ubiquinone/menaquinone biosynthesis C-methylase UbiE